MGSDEVTVDITVLGDTANTAARLSTHGGQGEIVVSETAFAAAGLDRSKFEQRSLELKGKSEPFLVYVLTDYAGAA